MEVGLVAVRSLSESDVAAVRAELTEGKQPTVWFTPTAVGVQPGASAKVVGLGEVTEGEFIKVRPTGSRDTMFCSASELTRTRPPRRRKAQPEASEEPPASAKRAAPAQAPAKQPAQAPAKQPAPAPAKAAAVSVPAASAPPPLAEEARRPVAHTESPAPAVRRSSDRRQQTAEVTVTLAASSEGDWTVEVVVGKKRTVRPLPVQPAEVATAARALPGPVTDAIEASLATARKRQVERVEQLRAELEVAQRTLRDLGG